MVTVPSLRLTTVVLVGSSAVASEPVEIEPPPSPNSVDLDSGAGLPVLGVTEFDGADAGPVASSLVAVTENVYGTPFVRPEKDADGVASGVTTVVVAGFDVTV